MYLILQRYNYILSCTLYLTYITIYYQVLISQRYNFTIQLSLRDIQYSYIITLLPYYFVFCTLLLFTLSDIVTYLPYIFFSLRYIYVYLLCIFLLDTYYYVFFSFINSRILYLPSIQIYLTYHLDFSFVYKTTKATYHVLSPRGRYLL